MTKCEPRSLSRIITALFLLVVPGAVANGQSTVDDFNPGADGQVHVIVVQPDGKILVGGLFDRLGGGGVGVTPRVNIGRVHADGSLDVDFNPGAGIGGVRAIALQPDGKILVGGTFSWLGGGEYDSDTSANRTRIGRLHADGTVDLSFDPGAAGLVNAIAVQPDGKILVAGCFSKLGGGGSGTTPRHSIGRLNADGSLDTSFDAGSNGCIESIALQPDGKIVVGGLFSTLGGGGEGTTTRYGIGRLNADGSLDASFTAGIDQRVHALVLQPDGKIVVGGQFTTLEMGRATTRRSRIGRLNADGSLDLGFDPGSNGSVHSLALQPDGKILAGGGFTRLGGGGFPPQSNPPRLSIGRVHSDGTLDASFNPGAHTPPVLTLAVQPDGKVLAGGGFEALGGGALTPRSNIGRIDVGPPVPENFGKRLPTSAATAQPTIVNVNWQPNASAASYEYCYDTTNDNNCNGSWSSTTTTSASVGPLTSATHYYWQVRARNAAGTTEADGGVWWSFTTSVTVALPTSVNDAFITSFNTTLAAPVPGVLANDSSNGGGTLSAALVANASHGTVVLNASGSFTYTPATGFTGTDSFTYRAMNVAGPGNIATTSITVSSATDPQPPTGFFASSVVGNQVTLRWKSPLGGPAPTDYVLEGGLNPGHVLGSIPLGTTTPVYTFALPNGAFFLRLYTMSGGGRSESSDEIRVFVNVPVPPSPPATLLALVNGSSLSLSWRNTFSGGAPTSLVVDVTGSITASLALPLTETFSFAGVPAGTYTLSVRAVNAAGSSAASNAVTLTFPSPCSGAPFTPTNFLAYKTGNTIHVAWDPAHDGAAPTSYVLNVTGAFIGSFPMTARTVSELAGAGAYGLSVAATNACGSSAPTSPQIVVIP